MKDSLFENSLFRNSSFRNSLFGALRRPSQTIFLPLLLLLLNALLALGAWEGLRQDTLVPPLSASVLRFRVLANSNSPEDQALKLQVRDGLLDFLSGRLDASESAGEAEAFVADHQEELLREAEKIVREAGYSYPVSLTVGDFYFPEKTYGDLTFPRGTYRALKVELGQGRGQNWWCVLYPPLCFTDAVTAQFPSDSRQKLENVLPEEEIALLEGEVEVRFALLDWLGSLFR